MNERGLDIASLTPEERLGPPEEGWDGLAASSGATPLEESQRAPKMLIQVIEAEEG